MEASLREKPDGSYEPRTPGSVGEGASNAEVSSVVADEETKEAAILHYFREEIDEALAGYPQFTRGDTVVQRTLEIFKAENNRAFERHLINRKRIEAKGNPPQLEERAKLAQMEIQKETQEAEVQDARILLGTIEDQIARPKRRSWRTQSVS